MSTTKSGVLNLPDTPMPVTKHGLASLIPIAAGVLAGLLTLWSFSPLGGLKQIAAWSLLGSEPIQPAEPVIIRIDQQSLRQYGPWPWSRKCLAELISKISVNQPAAIGLDILFAEETREDLILSQAIKDAKNVCLAETLNLKIRRAIFKKSIIQEGITQPPSQLTTAASKIGFIDLTSFSDEVGTMPLGFNKRYSFAASLIRIAYPEQVLPGKEIIIKTAARPEDFASFSAAEILSGKPFPRLQGKIVLVGLTAPGLVDWHKVANAALGRIPGVYLHAYSIANLLEWGGLKKVPLLLLLLLTLVFSSFISFWPQKHLLLAAFSGFILCLVVSFNLYRQGLWISPLLSGAAIVGSSLTRWSLAIVNLKSEKEKLVKIFHKYFSPQVIKEILTRPNPGAENTEKEVTVIFADLRGFTGWAENSAPKKVADNLNGYLEIMSRAIINHGGIIDKYLGDCVMAFFDTGNHSAAALKAALEIQLNLRNETNLPAGIGIATGVAAVGNIGPEFKKDYTVIGDVVNITARLEQLAKPGEICLTEAVARSAGITDEVFPVAVDGRIGMVNILCIKGKMIEKHQKAIRKDDEKCQAEK